MLTLEDGKALIRIAREAIKEELTGERCVISASAKKKYSEKTGVFVTLNKDKELRGCIGYIEPIMPLWKTVYSAAKNAAFSDPRFNPLSLEEFNNIEIEISVLTLPELIKTKKPEEYFTKIKIGRDGLIVEQESCRGLLLPQVFPEWKADAKKALEMTCQKAGLLKNSWKDMQKTRVYKFKCQIFSEENGKLVEKKLY